MKKNIFALTAILLGVAFTGLTHANPAPAPFTITNMSSSEKGIYRDVDNSKLTSVAQADVVQSPLAITNMSSSEKDIYRDVVDSNPTSYSKREVNGHVYESWVDNDTAYTKVDGDLVKTYKIDNGQAERNIINMSSNQR